ncbi:MAG: ribonuclease R [Inquilinaceae bacterium]
MAKRAAPFPSKDEVVAFIRGSTAPVGKREIARAFHITGAARIPLKAMIKELERDGVIERGRGRKVAPPDSLPPVAPVDIIDIDADGEVLARPTTWEGTGEPPRIFMAPERRGHPALQPGDRVLARLQRGEDGIYEGRTLRRIMEDETTRVVGTFHARPGGGVIEPAERGRKDSVFVATADLAGARDGDLVAAEMPGGRGRGPRAARIVERLGDRDDPRSISLIAIHAAGIPVDFPRSAIDQAEAAQPPRPDGRVDLRALPLVTIDGADARDFDDAVLAVADDDPANKGGWRLTVAIADVAHYVSPGSALDREAFKRGNSCYFPDRVVPMLPEALSNGLCSLRPGEDRACLTAEMTIDRAGALLRHRFQRGLMRSAARLTYEQVQAARDGTPDDTTGPLVDPVIAPLYGAFAALAQARSRRGTLELDLPERRITLGDDGRVASIGVRERLDSHRLIEEFMIAANVAAAETLSDRSMPCLFRVHDEPDRSKIEALREFLEPMGYRLAKGQVLKPRLFSQILEQARDRPEAPAVNQMVLRSQSQASYSPDNLGHFGLALARYAHFTSPIRRYADLTVHRALIRRMGLGDGGSPDEELERLDEIGKHISVTERRAMEAERDAADRYVAAFLSHRISEIFGGRIGGVTRFGLFVSLDDSGADGLVPISTLPSDFYDHDEHAHALVGRRSGRTYRLGDRVEVELIEADPISGSTLLAIRDAGAPSDGRAGGRPGKGPPGRRPGQAKGAARLKKRTAKPGKRRKS